MTKPAADPKVGNEGSSRPLRVQAARVLAAVAGSAILALHGAGAEGRQRFKAYGPEQGLVDPSFESLAQDADGFLWIGTQSGLVRYDGTRFQRWTSAEGLPSSWIHRIRAIPGGGLWVASREGLVRLQDGAFHPALAEGKVLDGGTADIDLDARERLCILRRDGAYRQTGPDTFERLPGGPKGHPIALACDRTSGSLYVGMDKDLWERRENGAWARLAPPLGGRLWTFAVDGRGRLWVAGDRKLLYRDPGTLAFRDATALLPAPPYTEGVLVPSLDGSLYIPTNLGLLRVRGEEHERIDGSFGLPGKWARGGMRDREGNLWVMGPALYRTLGGGYVRVHGTENGLPSEMVCCTHQDRRGRLWAGTNNGLALRGPRGWSRVPGTENLTVSSLAMDARGWLWMGLLTSPIRCLKPGAASASEEPFRALRWVGAGGTQSAPESAICLLADHQGNLWLGNLNGGIYRVDPASSEIHPSFGPADAHRPTLTVMRMLEDARGRIWAATSQGLACREAGRWRLFTGSDGLRHNAVHGIALGESGSVWVYYFEPSGLDRVSLEGGRFRVLDHLGASGRLVSNTVFSALQDARGALWVGTNRGLDHFQGRDYRHLGQGQGLAGEDCWANAICQASDGDLWQGTSNGLVQVRASQDPPPMPSPRAFILQVTQGQGRNRIWHPPFPRLPALARREATLEFQFSAPTYLDEASVQYQVRMIGLENDWRMTEDHQSRYAALPGGKYRFEVRAAYPGGTFGPAAAFELEVLPPWWCLGWVITLEILAGAALLATGVEWRLRALARQKVKLQALVAERTLELRKANLALEQANRTLETQSLTDTLTGLRNRRYLSLVIEDHVAQVLRMHRRAGGQALPNLDLVFLMIDLDHFKRINDTHGHGVGDLVLQRVAKVLTESTREEDAVIRWGGEEFLVVARNSSPREALVLAERVRSLMGAQCLVLDRGEELRWTCSIGFATYPFLSGEPERFSWSRVVEIADACLYLAKESGRDAWMGVQPLEGFVAHLNGDHLPQDLRSLVAKGLLEAHASRAMG